MLIITKIILCLIKKMELKDLLIMEMMKIIKLIIIKKMEILEDFLLLEDI